MATLSPKLFLKTKIQLRKDTLLNWQMYNPILSAGEPAVVWDNKRTKMKIGDGVHYFNDLPFTSGNADEALSAYYTKEEIDQNFYTKDELNEKLDNIDQLNELSSNIKNLKQTVDLVNQKKLDKDYMVFYSLSSWNDLTQYDRTYDNVPDGLIFIYDEPQESGGSSEEEEEEEEITYSEFDSSSRIITIADSSFGSDGYITIESSNASFDSSSRILYV